MVYDLPLADKKIKPHQVTALHLISALAFMGTGAIIFTYNYTITYWGLALLIAGALLGIVTVMKNKWITGRSVNMVMRTAELLVAGGLVVLSAMNGWKFPLIIFGVLSVAIAFSLYWEHSASKPMTVHIDDNGVRVPSLTWRSGREIPWTEIEQVVYRYGILTVDCLDNTLFQWNIAGKNADDEILEAYCESRIEEGKKNRPKNDW